MSLLVRILFALLVAIVIAPGPSGAQPRSSIPAETLLEAGRAALAAGALDDAEILLEGVDPREANIDELDFLHGSIAVGRGDWEAAITRFRAILARDPTLLRVRLDLALAFFRAREDSSAAYHFRQVLGAEDLPPAVRARTLAFLEAIRRRKSWSISASAALAPDSNINAATSARRVQLFGLPAQLSEDARQTSGVGVTVDIAGGYEARISPDLRFRTRAGLYTRTHQKSQFNDRTLTLAAGPRLIFENFDLRPELTARGRELGGRHLQPGGRAQAFERLAGGAGMAAERGGWHRTDLIPDIPRQRYHLQQPCGSCPRVRASHVAARRRGISP